MGNEFLASLDLLSQNGQLNYAGYLLADENGVSIKVAKYVGKDELALKEAVVNAIVHTDYSFEVPPVVELFSDRITITSYGGLPKGLSYENFIRCRSMPRNRELMRVFKDLELVEQLGSGMSHIFVVGGVLGYNGGFIGACNYFVRHYHLLLIPILTYPVCCK